MQTRALATYAARIRYEDLPDEVRRQARLLLLDFLGVAIFASVETPWGQMIREYAKRAGSGDATIICGNAQTSPALAALANGTAGLGFELEDIYRAGQSHPGPPVHAAALAVAESRATSGRDVLAAIVAGYEVMNRVSLAAAPHLVKRQCHPTAQTGVFGAAAAAGRCCGLGDEQMLHALGLAGVQSSGLNEAPNTGATGRRLYGGLPAQSGVQAAELAALGFTGPERVLEGKAGFLNVYADRFDGDKLLAGLGTHYSIMDVGIKRYATCAAFHCALDALLLIRSEHGLRPEDVVEIRAIIHRTSDSHAAYDVPNVTGAQFRLPYCLAVALHEGAANTAQFTEAKIRESALLRTARQVRTEFFTELRTDTPGRVTVILRDGRSITEEVVHPRGSPMNPLTDAERREKFRGLACSVLPSDRVTSIEQFVDGLENAPTVSPLVKLLREYRLTSKLRMSPHCQMSPNCQ